MEPLCRLGFLVVADSHNIYSEQDPDPNPHLKNLINYGNNLVNSPGGSCPRFRNGFPQDLSLFALA